MLLGTPAESPFIAIQHELDLISEAGADHAKTFTTESP
jgi:hypothetical protein